MNPFDTTGFPRRWECGEAWEAMPWLGWIHILSDLGTFVAYYAVPFVVMYFVMQRNDLRFPRIFYVFLAAIFLSCGTVHLAEAIIFVWPIYGFSGFMKLFTALVSCTGVFVLARLLPDALDLKSGKDYQRVVDERTKAQERLEHERFLLHTLMEHLPDAIYFKDLDGRFTSVSQSLAKSVGLLAKEVVGKTDADFFPADFAAARRRDEVQLMETQRPLLHIEERPHWPVGGDTWTLTSKFPLRDQAGKVVGVFGISHDISSQKQAASMFRSIVESSPNPILVVDSEGEIELVNAATEQMFGHSRDELKGRSVEILVPDRFRSRHVSLRESYFAEPRTRSMGVGQDLVGKRKDGSEVPIEVGLSPIEMPSGPAVLASVYDVTIRKEAEQTLISARDAAEGANRAKSDFLANMSHEIRTPMNAVIGMTELVLDSDLNNNQRDLLKTVMESAESLMTIINEILDFSKIEAGKLELESLDFEVREEIGETLKTLGLRAHSKGLELAWRVDPNVPRYLKGDAVRLRQIIVNLVGNAIKFTETGEVVVHVGSPKLDGERVELPVVVRDTGIGVSTEQQKRIFAEFEQADTSTTRQFGGTGLGLAIVSRLVHAMQGRIWIESQLGQGAAFHFTLQMALGDSPLGEVDIPDLSQVPMIVVDDNATNRRILEQILGNWNIAVTAVEGGHDALETLGNWDPDGAMPVVIVDVNMPNMDGFELVEQIRSMPEFAETPIVMLGSGGRDGDEDRRAGLNVGASLLKPVKQSELLNTLLTVSGQLASDGRVAPVKLESLRAPQALKVLLAEDGKANQVLAMGLLRRAGHSVELAVDGEEAVRRALQEEFDVILMDVQMPVVDGLEATRRIRKRERQTGRHVSIIAMTARAMKGDREKCLDAGMDHYLSKPIRKQQLFDAIAACVSVPEDATPDSPPPSQPQAEDPSREESIDWQRLSEQFDGSEEVVRDVAKAVKTEWPLLLGTMKKAIAEEQWLPVSKAAHTLKSNAQMLDLKPLAELMLEIEKDPNIAVLRMTELEGRSRRLLAEIEAFLSR